ncbi:unnamed protein product [Phaeothamnion confervicola]
MKRWERGKTGPGGRLSVADRAWRKSVCVGPGAGAGSSCSDGDHGTVSRLRRIQVRSWRTKMMSCRRRRRRRNWRRRGCTRTHLAAECEGWRGRQQHLGCRSRGAFARLPGCGPRPQRVGGAIHPRPQPSRKILFAFAPSNCPHYAALAILRSLVVTWPRSEGR